MPSALVPNSFLEIKVVVMIFHCIGLHNSACLALVCPWLQELQELWPAVTLFWVFSKRLAQALCVFGSNSVGASQTALWQSGSWWQPQWCHQRGDQVSIGLLDSTQHLHLHPLFYTPPWLPRCISKTPNSLHITHWHTKTRGKWVKLGLMKDTFSGL